MTRGMKQHAKRLWGWLKLPIAFGLLYLVLRQLELEQLYATAKTASPLWLVIAFVIFSLCQLFTVSRMNAYYRWEGFHLDFWYSFKLHYVGMFYNLVLPGGIGGDGYKVWLLKKNADYPAKKGIQIQLLTRTNGLLVLLMTILLTLPFVFKAYVEVSTIALLIGAGVLMLVGYLYVFIRLIRGQRSYEWRAMPYSLGVQAFSVMSMMALWQAIGAPGDPASYILLFQCAAIAGMIPISIGGLGLREFTFLYGAQLMNQLRDGAMVDAEQGVLISLLVFALNLITAAIGLIWLNAIGRTAVNGKNISAV